MLRSEHRQAKQLPPAASKAAPAARGNRRAHERLPLLHYLCDPRPGASVFAIWAQDISQGGLGLAFDWEVSPGDRFVLGVPVGGGEVDRLTAEVCYVRRLEGDDTRCWAGLRWAASSSPAQLESLAGYLAALTEHRARGRSSSAARRDSAL